MSIKKIKKLKTPWKKWILSIGRISHETRRTEIDYNRTRVCRGEMRDQESILECGNRSRMRVVQQCIGAFGDRFIKNGEHIQEMEGGFQKLKEIGINNSEKKRTLEVCLSVDCSLRSAMIGDHYIFPLYEYEVHDGINK